METWVHKYDESIRYDVERTEYGTYNVFSGDKFITTLSKELLEENYRREDNE